jgi:hypothetical protein
VSGDRTLDSFGGRDEQRDASSGDSDDGAYEATRATSAWTPDGECAACGATAVRRWRSGDAFVCADCANWDTGTSAGDQ